MCVELVSLLIITLDLSKNNKRKRPPEPDYPPSLEKQVKLSDKFSKTRILSEEFVPTSTIIEQFQNAKQPQILTQLFYTIGNSLAIRQFKDICHTFRSNTSMSMFRSRDIGVRVRERERERRT